MRALAVLLVILSHVFDWPRGGFIGVDVFFVISGFVITQQLMIGRDRTGKVSFLDFYAHRIKRILPAAVLVLAGTTIAARSVFYASRAHDVGIDALWALVFGANWHFADVGTDYFAAQNAPSPLQHFWSLSVEEQFYVVWPALFAVCGVAAARLVHRQARTLTAAVVTVLVVVSFVWAMNQSSSNATVAYFSTFTRAWELGVGVVLALVAAQLAAIPHAARPVLLLAGLAVVLVGAFIIDDHSQFPAPWAAVPVIGTALMIASGTGREPAVAGWPLRNPVAVFLGNISYGLYLWHWPLLIILADVMTPDTASYYIVVLGGTLVGATASFYLFEQPIKNSRWLNPKHPARRHQRHDPRGVILGDLGISLTVLVTLAVVATGLVVINSNDSSGQQTTASLGLGAASTDGATTAAQTPLQKAITVALRADNWPERLTPSLDTISTVRPPEDSAGCDDTSTTDPTSCFFGSPTAKHTVVVFGDSIALSWIAGIRAALSPLGWSVRGVTESSCPAANVVTGQIAGLSNCTKHRQWAFGRVAQLHPDLVVVSGTEGKVHSLSDHAQGQAANAEWQKGMTDTLSRLTKSAKRTVVLAPVSQGKNIQSCATRLSHPGDCISTISDTWYSISQAERAAAKTTGATYVDTRSWFCNPDGECPPFVGNILMRRDEAHITPQYARALAPQLRSVLAKTS
ncbi:acyltransferase family protein [uncultured Jatrophihabitans sp.]|uniref:acyltransferase family protein n=1 Tax=uncultured Jatrophihabitans sp. TaxID=1610747 RepID=UPI0035CC1828